MDDEFEEFNVPNDFKFDSEKVKKDIPNFSSEKLCEMIICYRYLSIHKELAHCCMEELAKRRSNGDNFLFEDYIEQNEKELPKLDFSVPDLRSLLSQLVKK